MSAELSISGTIGIDIGGSSIKLGLVGPSGPIAFGRALPLQRTQQFAAFANDIGDAIEALVSRHRFIPTAMGVAAPGFPDQATGRLAEGGQNVPPMQGGSLPGYLRRRFGTAAFLENDGVCAAKGELVFGHWHHYARYAVATVGTGVGGALIIDGRIILGRSGLPSEFGAISLDPNLTAEGGPVPGRLDRLGSADAMMRRYKAMRPGTATMVAKEIVALAESGDAVALQAVDETARFLAQAFGIMSNIVNLDAIVVGGGLAASRFFLDAVARHMPSFVWPSAFRLPDIVAAAHGNNAGLLGAALFASERLQLAEGSQF